MMRLPTLLASDDEQYLKSFQDKTYDACFTNCGSRLGQKRQSMAQDTYSQQNHDTHYKDGGNFEN
jgi:hypothetical protein